MDPVETFSGVMKRLRTLGYAYLPPRESLDAWREADVDTVQCHELSNYQTKRGLAVTGELDVATRQALVEDYGC